MTAMDHGSAHERIEDLMLDPVRLAGLESSQVAEDVALREHLAGCPACQADLDSWAQLQSALSEALPGAAAAEAANVQPIELPPSLRPRVLASVRSASAEASLAPMPMASERRRWASVRAPRTAWLGLAAAVAVLVVGAGVLVNQAARLGSAQEEAQSLTAAMAAVDRVLSTPDHHIVALTTAQGAAGGSISWTDHDLVVLSTRLTPPKPGEVYRCWLNSDGKRWPVGKMYFAEGTAFWVGSLDEWASFEIGPTTEFKVSLEPPGADPSSRSGPVVLSAALGS